MSKKFRRLYETAFDSKISKSDEDLLSADKQDAAIARRLSDQLQLSASAGSVRQCDDDDDDHDHGAVPLPPPPPPPSSAASCRGKAPPSGRNRLFGFLLRRRRAPGGRWPRSSGNSDRSYRSTDSVATGSSLSLESICTSDSLSSHSSESSRRCDPCRPPGGPHVLSPISDKSSQDYGATAAAAADALPQDPERRRSSAAAAAPAAAGTRRPPQSLGLIKLNGDDRQHLHGSDSGISVGSRPGDNYQELLDLPFDMPKLRRRPKPAPEVVRAEMPPEPLPFDMPKLRRRQTDAGAALPFDVPEPGKRQTDGRAAVEIGGGGGEYAIDEPSKALPFDIPKLKRTDSQNAECVKRPDRSSLFLDVRPSDCGAVYADDKPSLKTFQPKNQPNRPTLSLSNIKPLNFVEDIDVSLSLDQQCWYHGSMNRLEAERVLLGQKEGSYLVRGNKGSYALSIKSAKGFIHMRITQTGGRNYLGQSDRPFDTIPDLIRHYTLNKLPAKGAEHVGLIRPLAHQIL